MNVCEVNPCRRAALHLRGMGKVVCLGARQSATLGTESGGRSSREVDEISCKMGGRASNIAICAIRSYWCFCAVCCRLMTNSVSRGVRFHFFLPAIVLHPGRLCKPSFISFPNFLGRISKGRRRPSWRSCCSGGSQVSTGLVTVLSQE